MTKNTILRESKVCIDTSRMVKMAPEVNDKGHPIFVHGSFHGEH